jgi:adenine-specific DNA methylase
MQLQHILTHPVFLTSQKQVKKLSVGELRSPNVLEAKMKKSLNREVSRAAVLLMGFIVAVPQNILAQNHVVSPAQIQKDVSDASAVRQHNEEQLKSFLATKEMQQVMKSEGVNPQQVTNAVSQLNNADLARLAAKSQKAQRDFAGGAIGLGIFTLIGIVVVAAILIAVFA